jgi:hypothetical protein
MAAKSVPLRGYHLFEVNGRGRALLCETFKFPKFAIIFKFEFDGPHLPMPTEARMPDLNRGTLSAWAQMPKCEVLYGTISFVSFQVGAERRTEL